MQVDDKIAHAGIVDGRLCLGLPDVVSGAVVGIDADEVELGEIGKVKAVGIVELAPEDKVEELALRRRLHAVRLSPSCPRRINSIASPAIAAAAATSTG